MAVLGYTISNERMSSLLPKIVEDYTIVGLIFEIKKDGNYLDDIRIVPVFTNNVNDRIVSMKSTSEDSLPYNQNLLVEIGDHTNAIMYSGEETDYESVPTTTPLYLELDKFKGASNIPNFVFFDAYTLLVSITQKADFILSSAVLDTGTLLGTYDDTYGHTHVTTTFKIEVVVPENGLVPVTRKATPYLLGPPCADTW